MNLLVMDLSLFLLFKNGENCVSVVGVLNYQLISTRAQL